MNVKDEEGRAGDGEEAQFHDAPAAAAPAGVGPGVPLGQWAFTLCDCWFMFPTLPILSSALHCIGCARMLSRARISAYRDILLITLGFAIFFIAAEVLLHAYANGREYEYTIWRGHKRHRHQEEFEVLRLPDWYKPLKHAVEIVALVLWAAGIWVRYMIVNKYAIREPWYHSCAVAACCPPCALGQQLMHVDMVEYGEVQRDCDLGAKHPKEKVADAALH